MTRAEYLSSGHWLSCKRGSDLPQAKLDADKVRAIRANRHGKTRKQLAAEYGVHVATIEKICWRITWTHI